MKEPINYRDHYSNSEYPIYCAILLINDDENSLKLW